jgi:hypothetical protein
MPKTKHHKKSINNRKYGTNYDDHMVVFASDMNFWKYVLERTKQVVLIIDDKKLPKKVKKQLGGTGIGYEKIYVIAYPSLLDPSKILYKNIIFDANSYGVIDGFKHYIDSSVLDVEEYLASIKKSYETFKFLPREARIKEILVGNSEVFPKLDMQPIGDQAMFIRPDFQPNQMPTTMITNKNDTTTTTQTQDLSTMPSFIGNLSSYAKPSSEPTASTTPDINVSQNAPSNSIPDSGINYPPNIGDGQVTDGSGNKCDIKNYNARTNTCYDTGLNNIGIGNLDELTDGSGNRCKKDDYDAKTHRCRDPEEMATDSSGNTCKYKNIDPKTGRCNTVHDKNGVLCHKKNIGPDGKCTKPIVEEPAKPCKNKDPKTGKCLDTKPVPNKPTTDKEGNTIIKDKKTGNTITKKPDGTVEVRDAKGNIVKTNKEKKTPQPTDFEKEGAMMSLENSINKAKVETEPKTTTPTPKPQTPTSTQLTASKPQVVNVTPIKKTVPSPISNAARNNPKPSHPMTLRRRKGGRKTRKMHK